MKFFGRGKDVATDVAVGGPETSTSEPDNGSEKHSRAVVDDNSLDRVPSEDVQEGIKKIEAVTLTWTRNELILAYGV